ncbi:MAG TPA: UDP-N-acetylmuramoyl-L-alanyl-D-glutamate--2,6-diaminopimelate ligase [bacterium]|nr:UDP-N-acetylmuramoyl-L-alanyl-D-glutamate--2,6-diaminopimelate ligase [bacterium]
MRLDILFQGIPVLERIHWDPHRTIKNITSDSRLIEAGGLFVACRGSRMDGHDFLGQAVLAKASAILYERTPDIHLPSHVTGIRVANTQRCQAELLKRFYQYPDRKVKVIGVTGTNGKTTIAYLLHRLISEKAKSAYVGTLWYELPHEKIMAPNTTPGSETLFPLLKKMRHENVRYCVMEVSSHSLDQHRVHGIDYELALFTQLTQDHLDYHRTMERYFQAKRLLFTEEPVPKKMLINRDCSYGRRLLEEQLSAKCFSLNEPADYQAVQIQSSFQGSHFKLRFKGREIPFQIRFPMRHNVANMVAILGALDLLGFDLEDFRGSLRDISGVPGRLERVPGGRDFQVFVDYAHTPDAFENVLGEARKLNPRRILTLFGCGGDRDRAKRPLMMQAACRYSDLIVLTSDNPRSEDPEMILEDIKKGILPDQRTPPEIHEILDRREAIERIISLAEPGDIIFVLGKGHEDYQILGDKKIAFDDRQVVQECLTRKSRVFFS